MMQSNEIPKISRRSLLKTSTAALAASGFTWPKNIHAAEIRRLETLIDLSLCDGCTDREVPACVSACKTINKDKIPPIANPIPVPWPRKTVEDWSRKREVFNRLTPYNYIYVDKIELDQEEGGGAIFVPRRCMHCDNPACATICPFAANHKNANGAVVIDQDLCFGGAKCKAVCPWEIPQRQSGVGIYLHVLPHYMGNGVMYKCDLCNDRLREGKQPGCIEACPREAMLIGPRKDIVNLAEERARKVNGYIYGKNENGGTSTLYVSPVSFDLINKKMKKEHGRPDMQTGVKRKMYESDTIGKVVLAAPVVGIFAGVAGAFKWLTDRKSKIAGEEKQDG